MGRRKIEIQPITHERNRSVTFLKRKNGLFKKAYELGVLCSVDIAVIIFENRPGHGIKCYEYTSAKDVRDVVARHVRYDGEKDTKTPRDFNGPHGKESEDEQPEDEGGLLIHSEDDEEEEEKPARKRGRMDALPASHRRKHRSSRSRSRSRSPHRPNSSSHHRPSSSHHASSSPAYPPGLHPRQLFFPPPPLSSSSYLDSPHTTLFPPPPRRPPMPQLYLPYTAAGEGRAPPPLSHYPDGRADSIFGFLGERPFEWPRPPPPGDEVGAGDWLDFLGGGGGGGVGHHEGRSSASMGSSIDPGRHEGRGGRSWERE
ncbi:SRF-like protein [Cylindrobasidium torrendii FP15055 ss-10]|uniref:SRF-like protein n=1 Tax=Cylindrobasidium torrendii FP15055 ss-10 TaxID=1314674 RepID=A0A0D7B7B6_9AGAR|nr:SRF-like protein [Cylindrobasidium torrendii FP15055 ss-10]